MSGVLENSIASARAFDRIAPDYDAAFSASAIGRAQRNAVWIEMDRAFQPGQRVLEINCGTGIDAVHMALRGIEVDAFDAAPGMIALSEQRAKMLPGPPSVRFQCLRTEELGKLTPATTYDGVLSNFSGLNCIIDLQPVVQHLSRLVRPGGKAVFCIFGVFCFWEVLWYLSAGTTTKAFRRFRHEPVVATLAPGTTVGVRYWRVRELERVFHPYFRLQRKRGVGVAVPPSYTESLVSEFPRLFRAAVKLDAVAGRCPIIRSTADHVVLTFERLAGSGKTFLESPSRPPEAGGQRDPTGSREGRFHGEARRGFGFGTPARVMSTASPSRCPPDSGGRDALLFEFFRSLREDAS